MSKNLIRRFWRLTSQNIVCKNSSGNSYFLIILYNFILDVRKTKITRNKYGATTLVVMKFVQNNIKLSLRRKPLELSLSETHIYKILKQLKFYPFFKRILKSENPAWRLDFWLCIDALIINNNQYYNQNILFSDEITF